MGLATCIYTYTYVYIYVAMSTGYPTMLKTDWSGVGAVCFSGFGTLAYGALRAGVSGVDSAKGWACDLSLWVCHPCSPSRKVQAWLHEKRQVGVGGW